MYCFDGFVEGVGRFPSGNHHGELRLRTAGASWTWAPGSMQKYEEETARHRPFGELCDEIVRINGRICDLRPVPEAKEVMEEGAQNSRSSLMRP